MAKITRGADIERRPERLIKEMDGPDFGNPYGEVPELPSVVVIEPLPATKIKWQKNDVDREGRVYSWIAPERELRIVLNRGLVRGEVTPDTPGVEWCLLYFTQVKARSTSLQELFKVAEGL